jgi:predicted membrane protein
MGSSTAVAPRGIGVKAGIYCAVLGALGCILTLFAIPIGPNININLYVISGIMVGATCGPWLGLFGGFLGSLYTPVLWGWFGAVPYNAFLGLGAGAAARYGVRPSVGVVIAYIISTPVMSWAQVEFLGIPMEVVWLGVASTAIQTVVVCAIVESLISVPHLRKRLPGMREMTVPGWVARSAILRHPWVEESQGARTR